MFLGKKNDSSYQMIADGQIGKTLESSLASLNDFDGTLKFTFKDDPVNVFVTLSQGTVLGAFTSKEYPVGEYVRALSAYHNMDNTVFSHLTLSDGNIVQRVSHSLGVSDDVDRDLKMLLVLVTGDTLIDYSQREITSCEVVNSEVPEDKSYSMISVPVGSVQSLSGSLLESRNELKEKVLSENYYVQAIKNSNESITELILVNFFADKPRHVHEIQRILPILDVKTFATIFDGLFKKGVLVSGGSPQEVEELIVSLTEVNEKVDDEPAVEEVDNSEVMYPIENTVESINVFNDKVSSVFLNSDKAREVLTLLGQNEESENLSNELTENLKPLYQEYFDKVQDKAISSEDDVLSDDSTEFHEVWRKIGALEESRVEAYDRSRSALTKLRSLVEDEENNSEALTLIDERINKIDDTPTVSYEMLTDEEVAVADDANDYLESIANEYDDVVSDDGKVLFTPIYDSLLEKYRIEL